jgi:hypothetical protein
MYVVYKDKWFADKQGTGTHCRSVAWLETIWTNHERYTGLDVDWIYGR